MKTDTKAIKEKKQEYIRAINAIRELYYRHTQSWGESDAEKWFNTQVGMILDEALAPHNQTLIDQIKEKKKTMAYIVGAKRVETDYITLDDLLPLLTNPVEGDSQETHPTGEKLLSSENSTVSGNGVKSEHHNVTENQHHNVGKPGVKSAVEHSS